jgi:uncharacterized membrane protein (DUF485 family)
MASEAMTNWAAIDADPRFQELHRRKSRVLWTLMALSVVYYFLLPLGAAYCPALFRTRIWGPINFGIFFALSQFIVTWIIAYIYYRKATREFDLMAEELARAAASAGRVS